MHNRWVKAMVIIILIWTGGEFAPCQENADVSPLEIDSISGNAGLFVGVNVFSMDGDRLPLLRYAVDDAVAQAGLFVNELKLISANHCYLALSGEPTRQELKNVLRQLQDAGATVTDGGKSSILKAVLSVRNVAKRAEDLLVASFSSHGFEKNKRLYIMPAAGMMEFLEDTALDLDTVNRELNKSKAQKRLLIVDACRELADSKAIRRSAYTMSNAFRRALTEASGQAVLASCDVGQYSWEKESLKHGVFTYYFLEALRGKAPADPQNGFITLGAVSRYVAEQVSAYVKAFGHEQDPWFEGQEKARHIPLAISKAYKQKEFQNQVDAIMPKLLMKVEENKQGVFNFDLFSALGKRLKGSRGNSQDREIVKACDDFIAGKIMPYVFASYIEKQLGLPIQAEKSRPLVEHIMVTFNSDPAGAAVFIGEALACPHTPCSIPLPPGDIQHIKMKKQGYSTWFWPAFTITEQDHHIVGILPKH